MMYIPAINLLLHVANGILRRYENGEIMLKKGIARHIQISNWITKKTKDGTYQINEKLPSKMIFVKGSV